MRFLDRLNHALEPHLPEQRLFLRSARGTRFVRFRPVTLATITLGAGVGLAWSIFATAVFFMDLIGDGNAREQAMLEQSLYEQRLNQLAADRDQRSAEAESAIRRFYTALDKVSDMQTELLSSEERRRELETAIDVLQGKLRDALRDREAATKRADALAAELGRLTGSVRTTAGELDELRATTDYLATVLTETAAERDDAVLAALDAEDRAQDVRRRLLLAQERSERVFARLEDAIAVSVEPLEKVFRKVGLDPDRLIATVRAGYSGQGGPLTPIAMSTKG
ncbi:MAG: M23 family peptidase, partial [Alphaproteobacteria bacterium]